MGNPNHSGRNINAIAGCTDLFDGFSMTSRQTVPDHRDNTVQGVSVAIRRDAQFLLVLRGREPAKGLYAFPGGKVRAGEELEDAARREVFEETGLTLRELKHYGDLEIEARAGNGPSYRLAVFVSADPGGVAVAGDDAAALGWYGLDRMAGLPMTESSLQIAGDISARWPAP